MPKHTHIQAPTHSYNSVHAHPFWRVFGYLRFYPGNLAATAFFELLAILFNLSSFIFIVPFVDLLFGGNGLSDGPHQFSLNQRDMSEWLNWQLTQWSAQYGVIHCLIYIALAYLGCSLLSNLFRYLASWFLSFVHNGIIERLRNEIFHRITILPVHYFKRRRTGDILSSMSNDISDVEWSIISSINSVVKSPINIVVFAATLVFISPALFLWFLLITPVVVLLVGFVGKHLKRNARKGQDKLGSLFSVVEENVANVRVVKAFGGERRQADFFASVSRDYCRRMNRVVRLKELGSPLSEVIATLAMAAVVVIGGSYVIGGSMQPSVFILFVVVSARIVPPIHAMVRAWSAMQKGNASAARIFAIIDADEVIEEATNAMPIASFENKIEYRDVSFSYPDADTGDQEIGQSTVLNHINLTIPKGKVVALVGHSGAGKSTLADLLPRFYDPTGGHIAIDGTDIRHLKIDSLRRLISVVTQDCILFNDTIAANIAFGATAATSDQIRQAARLAYADGFIETMPDSYDTVVGDRGMTLSGGQRQRICIARALLKNAPILILDEATAALDTDSERQVQEALRTLMHNRTTIVIAHRLSTIRSADVIHVLDKGHIVESGTHDELIGHDGPYKSLLAAQV